MLDVLFAAIIATSAPAPQSPIDVYPAEVGNGVISEDESGWSCVGMAAKSPLPCEVRRGVLDDHR